MSPIEWYTKVRSGRGQSAYKKYYDQPVAITTPNADLLFSPRTMEMLGHPAHVKIGLDQLGCLVIEPSDDDGDFNISYVRGKKSGQSPEKTQMARVAATFVVKSNGMVSDTACFVWTVAEYRGYLGIDLKQKRGLIPFQPRHRQNGKGKN